MVKQQCHCFCIPNTDIQILKTGDWGHCASKNAVFKTIFHHSCQTLNTGTSHLIYDCQRIWNYAFETTCIIDIGFTDDTEYYANDVMQQLTLFLTTM